MISFFHVVLERGDEWIPERLIFGKGSGGMGCSLLLAGCSLHFITSLA